MRTGQLNVVSTWNREKLQSIWDGGLLNAISKNVEQAKLVMPKSRKDLLQQLPDADVILAGSLDKELLAAAPRCKVIHSFSGGVENLLFPELLESSIRLACMKGCFDSTAAEHALAMMLIISRRLYYDLSQRLTRLFDNSQRGEQREIQGKTLGIVGLGGIGKSLATVAQCLGMQVVGVARNPQFTYPGVKKIFRPSQLDDMLKVSDFVAICVPVTRETRSMIKTEELKAMKSTAFLLDVSGRKELYEIPSLEKALHEGWIGGAFMQFGSPPPPDSPFWELDNFYYSFHRTNSQENNARCIDRICENLNRLIKGQPLLGEVDKMKGY